MMNKLLGNDSFKNGLRDSISFGLAFIFLFIPIGALAASQGLSLFEVMSASILIFSTPLQFLLIQSHQSGLTLIPIILALNSRFILMSSALVPYLKHISMKKIMLFNVIIIPSVFSACIAKFKNSKENYFLYFLGVGLPIYFVSVLSTLIGYVIGGQLMSTFFLEVIKIVLPLQFTALAAKHWPDLFDVSAYWIALILTPVFLYFLKDYTMLIAPFVIGIALALIETYKKRG